jgi:hypothetical protein
MQGYLEIADAVLNAGTVFVKFEKFLRIAKDTGKQAQLLEIVGIVHTPRWFIGTGISTQAGWLLPFQTILGQTHFCLTRPDFSRSTPSYFTGKVGSLGQNG